VLDKKYSKDKIMTVGILQLIIFIPESNSLKRKRMVLHSIKARLRNNFNVAVSQIDGEDKWQKAMLAVVGVEKTRQCVDSNLQGVINYVKGLHGVNLLDYEMEFL